jgi:hypothetical protein
MLNEKNHPHYSLTIISIKHVLTIIYKIKRNLLKIVHSFDIKVFSFINMTINLKIVSLKYMCTARTTSQPYLNSLNNYNQKNKLLHYLPLKST